MATKKTAYAIRATENVGGKRRTMKMFGTKKKAKAYIKKVTSKGKIRTLPSGKKFRLTSFRDAQSGVGIKNPRIKKVKSYGRYN